MSRPKIKTNYQSSMKELKYSVNDLAPSVRKFYEEVEKNIGILNGMYDNFEKLEDGEEKEELRTNIEASEGIVLEQDEKLCKAIAGNKALKEKAQKMQAARKHNQPPGDNNKKDDTKNQPPAAAKPAAAPASTTEQAKPPAQNNQQTNIENKPAAAKAAAPAKNNGKSEEENLEKKEDKGNVGKVVGWVLGGALALACTWFSLPIPNLKNSFTFKLKK